MSNKAIITITKTSGQVISHTATSPPHMDGLVVFVRWRQHAPTSNTWFPWPIHPSHHPKLHLDRFSCFHTAHGKESLHFTMGHLFPPPSNCPFTLWIWTLSNNGSLGPPETISKLASRTVQPFLQGSQSCQTDRQTDHATPSTTIGRIYLVVRCGLITKIIATTLSLTGNCTESLHSNTTVTMYITDML